MNTTLLKDSSKVLEKLTQAISSSIFIYDLEKDSLSWFNNRAEELYGYTQQELATHSSSFFFSIIHPDDQNYVKNIVSGYRNLKESELINFEYRVKHKNGIYHWIQVRAISYQRNENDQVTAVLGISSNVDSQKEAEAKLISSTKMAALGEMSGGIAHEINNPLTVIQARAFQLSQLLEAGKLDSEKIKQIGESISRTADKITRIIKSLRTFSRAGDSDPFELAPIKQIIEETLEFCRTRFYNHGVEIEVSEIDPELEVECRIVQIEQVLLNLLNNSFDAIQKFEERWIRISVSSDDEFLEINVTDSGHGIPEDIIQQIMLPFFTTKSFGKGTGLGLSISKEIVKNHNGELYVRKESPNTCFVIRLPLWQNHN